MGRTRKLIDPVRSRLVDLVDAELDAAREHLQTAQDIADLLNAADESGADPITIDGNVVLGLFNKSGGKVDNG